MGVYLGSNNVGMFGGQPTGGDLRPLSITPSTSPQSITPEGFDGYNEVNVSAIQTETKTVTENGTYAPTAGKLFSEFTVNVNGLPSGFTKIATGSHVLSADVAGGSTFTVNHNLGVVPDMFIFYHEGNVATTYSMLMAARCSTWNWRSSTYLNKCFYHGNSTTTATGTDVTTSYGIKTLSTTQATITTYSTSTSYYWRAGTYKWIAIKF